MSGWLVGCGVSVLWFFRSPRARFPETFFVSWVQILELLAVGATSSKSLLKIEPTLHSLGAFAARQQISLALPLTTGRISGRRRRITAD